MAKIRRTLKKKVADVKNTGTTTHQPLRYCPACQGDGKVNDTDCRPCRGSGKVPRASYGPTIGESPLVHTFL